MDNNIIAPLLENYNDVIDCLISDYKEFNEDEDALAFITKRSKNFINSTNLTLTTVIFPVLENKENCNSSLDIDETKALVEDIFKSMNNSIDHILEHEEKEEMHIHGHDHHHHHIHIEIENVQDDISNLTDNLTKLRDILNSI